MSVAEDWTKDDEAAPAAADVLSVGSAVHDDSGDDEAVERARLVPVEPAQAMAATEDIAVESVHTWRLHGVRAGVLALVAAILFALGALWPSSKLTRGEPDVRTGPPSQVWCSCDFGPQAAAGDLRELREVLWPRLAISSSLAGGGVLSAPSSVTWVLSGLGDLSSHQSLERAAARHCLESGGAPSRCAEAGEGGQGPAIALGGVVIRVSVAPGAVDRAVGAALQAAESLGQGAGLRRAWEATKRPPPGSFVPHRPVGHVPVTPDGVRRLGALDAGWRVWGGWHGTGGVEVAVPFLGAREDFTVVMAPRGGSGQAARRWSEGLGPFPAPGNSTEPAADAAHQAVEVTVRGGSAWGALRGMDVAAQALWHSRSARLSAAAAVGFPWRWWRGLHADTARHFLPVPVLASHLLGMAASGLNVLHWHAVDAQSFPLALGPVTSALSDAAAWSAPGWVHPNGTAGRPNGAFARAGAPSLPDSGSSLLGEDEQPRPWRYTADDVADVVALAADLGVRVMPELDIPAHAASWGAAVPGVVARCPAARAARHEPDIKTLDLQALDPSAGNGTLALRLAALAAEEVAAAFPDAFLHTGGDEVSADCWEGTPSVAALLRGRGWTPARLQVEMMRDFANATRVGADGAAWDDSGAAAARAGPGGGDGGGAASAWPLPDALPTGGLPALRGKATCVWQEAVESASRAGAPLPAAPGGVGAVFPWVWWDSRDVTSTRQAIAQGRGVVWTSGWYMDVVGEWDKMYADGPLQRARISPDAPEAPYLWGGESAMWAEKTDRGNAQCRVWPRAAAVAERLWTPPGAVSMSGGAARAEGFAVAAAVERLALFAARVRGSGRAEASTLGLAADDAESAAHRLPPGGLGDGSDHLSLVPDRTIGRCGGVSQLTQRPPRWGGGAARPSADWPPRRRLRVLSWNIDEGGKEGLGDVEAVIRREAPDVAVVVEADNWERRGRRLGAVAKDAAAACGMAHAAVLLTVAEYRLAVMSASRIRVLWSERGHTMERGALAVETGGVVVVALHLHAHSASARAEEARAVASVLPALREAAVRAAGPGERLRKWGCAGPASNRSLSACAARVAVVVAGDLNTMSPLDAPCHEAESVASFLRSGTRPGRPTADVPARMRPKYLNASGGIDYEPMRAMLRRPAAPPRAELAERVAGAGAPGWWTSPAPWSSEELRPATPSVDAGREELGPLVDLLAAGWASGAPWRAAAPAEGEAPEPATGGGRCTGTQPTALSMLSQVPAEAMPPFRLDYILAGPPGIVAGAGTACRVLVSGRTRLLSDHFPVMCAMSV